MLVLNLFTILIIGLMSMGLTTWLKPGGGLQSIKVGRAMFYNKN